MTAPELVDAVETADRDAARLERSATHRDNLIHRALDGDWTYQRIAEKTGLHVEQVAQIARSRS